MAAQSFGQQQWIAVCNHYKLLDDLSADERQLAEQQLLLDMKNVLSVREREILKLRYGILQPDHGSLLEYCYTLKEIGQIFDVCRERVRQTQVKACRKLLMFYEGRLWRNSKHVAAGAAFLK